ncbi:uncharacterized protein At5g41620-like isoform X2 [Salvia miltiorrhiza]|uniref:uncharacterized protein At5g41620-like isoform X2 n=1 Tax=Salvia miltiorrhiza TaxID=226208 RepID=UPI0025AD55F3|nr:uncharacterized protein At5g41620-like isoform X2 [Salvia miltiorrhiza]
MERGEESGEEKAEFLWEKLRNVGKRGHSTPAASFWRRKELHDTLGIISSRKLAAAFWELHQYKPLTNMRRRLTAPPPPTLPESWSNSRRRVADLLRQHHRSIETSSHATQTVSPSSCSSSMEIALCNPATSPSSIELKGRNGELTYSFRTSTEVLRVLNRVWSLEEQHVSNMSLIKALKKELGRARFHAKELVRDQQGGRHEMVELMKNITGGGGKPVRKSKAKVESTRDDELEHERKLRKQSETLQRKLAQELYEVKRSVASVSKELEKERTSRSFLEELCDELAWAVRDCEKDQRQKSDSDLGERGDHDQLILRISQAWLDERMQQHQTIQNERNGNQMVGNPMYRRSSLESIPINMGASARQEEDDDDDGSSSSHSTCFEVDKINECSLKPQGQKLQENHFEEMLKIKEFKEKLESSDRRALSPSRLQAKFEEHMARAMSHENGMPVNKDDATLRKSSQSPVREWTQKRPARESETTSKFLPELKECTLRGKLFEARSEGQKSRSRQRASIYPSRGE